MARSSDPLVDQPGELRHRIAIQQDQRQTSNVPRNKVGEAQPSWGTVATRWASIEAAGGREFWFGQQVTADTTHLVKMRFYAGLNAEMRLVFQGRRFEIVYAQNPGEQQYGTLMGIQVKEVPAELIGS